MAGSAQFKLLPNKGQWEENVLFESQLNACKLFVSKGELTYLFYNSTQLGEAEHNQSFDGQLEMHALKVKFLNSSPNAIYTGIGKSEEYYNYYVSNQSSKWKAGIYAHSKLFVSDIYPRIDFELYEDKGALKYNFIVRPGGNIEDIRLAYEGADSMFISNGVLNIKTRFGLVNELKPYVYEQSEEGESPLASAYALDGNIMHFEVSGKRNNSNTLVIDPALVFSSYSGSRADNFGYTGTFDNFGRGIAGGTVFNVGYPTQAGSFQIDFAGGNVEFFDIGYIERDCGIMVFEPDGKSLKYCTYLGGSFSNDQPHSMIVDSDNNLLVMGTTKSADFPIGIAPAFDDSHNGKSDVFVVKFSPDGTQLIAGTFIGGKDFDGLNGDRPTDNISDLLYNYADDFRGEITIDGSDDIYVATTTMSSDFPTKNGFDQTYGGGQDGCVFKLSSDLSSLIYSSYIGDAGDDAAYGLDLGTHGDLYVTGGSNSNKFNYSVPGLSDKNNGGKADGYIVRIDLSNFSLIAQTFIGTSAYDQTYFVKVDKYGKPFIFGQSEGQHARSANVFGIDNSRMFIKKLSLDLTAIELQTTFGSQGKTKPDISPSALLVDECERIFISGWGAANLGGFLGGTTNGMPITNDAFQKTTDGADFYLAVFSKNLNELQYATYFGGRSSFSADAHEHVDGGTSRFDKKGIVYQSVCAGCGGQSLFPTTPGAWSNTNKSRNCNNALFKFDFENLNRKPMARDSFFEIYASDTLNFWYEVSDPDLSDSLKLVLEGDFFKDSKFPRPLPFIKSVTKGSGKNSIRANIVFYSGCQHAGLDTMRLYVKVYDQGCPTQDSNRALIKILVKDPPLTITPEAYCINFNPDGSVNLSWKSFAKNKFFKYVLLKRINSNGSQVTIDTVYSNLDGSYRDKPGVDPRNSNISYYMVGYNLCNKAYDAGLRVNTTKEFNTPIDSTYIHYATVFEDRQVQVNWFKSREEDFESYDVYRADNINNTSVGYRLIKTIYDINDTIFNDPNVKVSEKSYFYKIGVNDKCGHTSKPSNEACNIVLKGQAGHLYFDLNWSPYRDWVGGVNNYILERKVDTGEMRFLTNTSLLRTHHDDELDLWWGAYFYVVKAFEGFDDSGKGYGAKSLSNSIRLIQPPMVFVPNAFSPNGDGFNDVWGVSHAFVRDFRMQVYNRWGEKVWDNDFKGNQWDGVTRGELAMNDVFIWIVTYKGWDGKFYTQKGTVTVMP